MVTKNGANIILDILIENGVDTVFGYPGGASMPLYDALFLQHKIKHILTCHEQAATHAAEGYARSTGKLGVVFLTSGPGATNGVTGIADAMLDSTPILVITAQVLTGVIGSDAFQEADIIGITKPITKHNYLVKNISNLHTILTEAINIAMSGRHGPVVIDIPKDIHVHTIDFDDTIKYKTRSSYQIKTEILDEELKPAIDLIVNAKKPVFYCGGGVISSGEKTAENLQKLVKLTKFPITTTFMGLGCYPSDDKQCLQMLGMHGSYEANMAMYEADLIIAIGVRFDDRVTGKLAKFSPNSKKIHIDIDPSELNKNVKVDVAINGDCGIAIEKLYLAFSQKSCQNIDEWWGKINNWREKKCFGYNQTNESAILPQYALDLLYQKTKNQNPVFTTDVGQHQMWAAQYCKVSKIRKFISSGGLGTMGYGIPAAIGVKIAKPEELVICITGDGSFMMNMQELGTVKRYKIPVKIIMLNNGYLGMVRQWQDIFFEGRLMEVDSVDMMPDFITLCNAFEIKCSVVEKIEDLENNMNKMLENPNEPYLLVVNTKRNENVYPMIPPGAGHNEMMFKE